MTWRELPLREKKQRAEAKGLAEIVTSREALKMQLEMESNPEYFIPGEKSSHKPPKAHNMEWKQGLLQKEILREEEEEEGEEAKAEVEAGGEEDSVNCHQLQTLPEEFLNPNELWNKAVQILRWL